MTPRGSCLAAVRIVRSGIPGTGMAPQAEFGGKRQREKKHWKGGLLWAPQNAPGIESLKMGTNCGELMEDGHASNVGGAEYRKRGFLGTGHWNEDGESVGEPW